MKTTFLFFITLLVLVALLGAQCGAAPVQETAESKISVLEPAARASIPNGAVFMKLMNEGNQDDLLLSAESEVAEAVELHESKMDENEVMKMSPVPNIPVPAGETVTLEPGGLHVMLMGLKEELAPGDKFSLTLNFERAGPQTIEVEVSDSLMGQQMEHN
jgi:copper(I)-binding protein